MIELSALENNQLWFVFLTFITLFQLLLCGEPDFPFKINGKKDFIKTHFKKRLVD